VEWETTDEGTFAIYHGKRIKSTADKPIASTGTASTVDPIDWDGDGDLDLIVGNINGDVFLVPNEGTAQAYAFGKETQLQVDGQPLRVDSRAGPCATDWDGDGDLDLLVGDDQGKVSLYRNTGSATAPKLAKAVELVAAGHTSFGAETSAETVRGTRAKICVADWNNDGKPDLLVGDLATQKSNRPDPTPEQEIEYAKLRREMETLLQRRSELIQKITGPSRVRDEAERQKVQEELSKVSERLSKLQSQLPREYDLHGWVWLFLRK
jgi:hypothetical protein